MKQIKAIAFHTPIFGITMNIAATRNLFENIYIRTVQWSCVYLEYCSTIKLDILCRNIFVGFLTDGDMNMKLNSMF